MLAIRYRAVGRALDEPASYPAPDVGPVDGALRVYFARRDEAGRSRAHFVPLDPGDPLRRLGPVAPAGLELGPPGTFDADGHAPRCVVEAADGARLLYLIGWNRAQSVPYHLAIGRARSLDGGRTWDKLPGPVLDRSADEPFLCTSPCVLLDGDTYRMWYCGGTGWEEHDGRAEPLYRVHHAESADGVRWRRTPHVCVDAFSGGDAIGWPSVWKEAGGYRMLFSYRARSGFRDDPDRAYRTGYATSVDGLAWEVRLDEFRLDRSEEGWDSVMAAYATPRGGHLFYNGNGFGRTGIGVARRADFADNSA